MILVRMLAGAFKILGSMDGNIIHIGTFASGCFAFQFATFALEEIVGFVKVITKTFG
jgi:hypothetical protein